MTCYEAIADCIEKLDVLAFLLELAGGWAVGFRPTLVHVPDHYLVPITDATKRD